MKWQIQLVSSPTRTVTRESDPFMVSSNLLPLLTGPPRVRHHPHEHGHNGRGNTGTSREESPKTAIQRRSVGPFSPKSHPLDLTVRHTTNNSLSPTPKQQLPGNNPPPSLLHNRCIQNPRRAIQPLNRRAGNRPLQDDQGLPPRASKQSGRAHRPAQEAAALPPPLA